jgi:hypothetical protein
MQAFQRIGDRRIVVLQRYAVIAFTSFKPFVSHRRILYLLIVVIVVC